MRLIGHKIKRAPIYIFVHIAIYFVYLIKINKMKLIQFEALFVRDFVTDVWPFPLHNHNHYELIYIHDGAGKHHINGETTPYKAPAIFFLKPEDTHEFIIEQPTHFSVLKFLPEVLPPHPSEKNAYWQELLHSLSRIAVQPQPHQPNERILKRLQSIFYTLVSDWRENNEKVNEIHPHLLRALLLLLAKGTQTSIASLEMEHYGHDLIDKIQNYIHHYIQHPSKLSITALSSSFGRSESGIKALFKREMGVSLRTYIQALKLQLLKERIGNGSSSLSEIAQDFGFVDTSHFHRFFKKQTGQNPLTYRKENKR